MNGNKVGNVHINVALKRVHVTIIAVAKHYYIFRVCVCSLCYCSMKAYEPYYIVICRLFGSNTIFPHYLKNGAIFGKKML
jgi:hypothetical protein